MVRPPCCGEDEEKVKKGPWTAEEDAKLVDYITNKGHTNWKSLPKLAGLNRCGKSCRLRWTNYLRPDIKRGKFSDEEERLIINLHSVLSNNSRHCRWSRIATHLPGRTDNEIKNYYNTHIRKKLLQMGIDPQTHKPRTDHSQIINLTQLIGAAQQLNSMMMLSNNSNGLGNSNNNYNTSVTNGIISNGLLTTNLHEAAAKVQLAQNLLHLFNPTTATSASPFLAQQQLSQQFFCNQLINTLPALATAGGSSLMVNNSSNGALAMPGLVSPEASSSTSLVHTNNVNGGGEMERMKMESGNNNNYQQNFSDGTTATAADVGGEYEAWEKMLLMDDDFAVLGGSTFFSSWKDDHLVLE
ncbi:unnamed protein product [Linum tenue]|uniref:Uncharacterized protein n=1 Tax=Linum tenue TaxID=586396 RepID=A0AAV0Q2Y2_9ROSI|nr:unnamed protein product [Linum tenue]